MKLLREYFELCDGGICQDLLTEDEKRRVREEGAVILSGVMQMAETENGNGRKYSQKIAIHNQGSKKSSSLCPRSWNFRGNIS